MALIPLLGRDGELRGHAIVDAEDFGWLTDAAEVWRLAHAGYAKCAGGGRGRAIYMHRLLLGLDDGDGRHTDHINGDRLDNRRANLRVATHAENMQNKRPQAGKSRFRGVSRDASGRWRAGCNVAGVWTWFGTYDTEDEAARAAVEARAVHQPFAVDRRQLVRV